MSELGPHQSSSRVGDAPIKRPRGRPRKNPLVLPTRTPGQSAQDSHTQTEGEPRGYPPEASNPGNLGPDLTSEDVAMEGAAASFVSAGVASGSVLAIVTLVPAGSSWEVSRHRTRMFHLEGREQINLRELGSQIYEFTMLEKMNHIAFCRTRSGPFEQGLSDEVRIEAVLSMVYGLQVVTREDEAIAAWSREAGAAFRQPLAGWSGNIAMERAVELAHYEVARTQRKNKLAGLVRREHA